MTSYMLWAAEARANPRGGVFPPVWPYAHTLYIYIFFFIVGTI